jgi:hypothetical protein
MNDNYDINDDDDDACLHQPSIVESNKNNFNAADFIIPAVMEYLGIRSLVNFGSVCKTHRGLLSNEVERRKAYIATIEKEVLRLMRRNVPSLSSTSGDDDYEIHTRATIMEARTLSNEALRLIDDEINLSAMYDSQSALEHHVFIHGNNDFFINERKKFFHRHSTVGSFYILPDAFYFPPVGEAKPSSEAQILFLMNDASRINGVSVHWDNVLIWEIESREYAIELIAHVIAVQSPYGTIDAYRIAARKTLLEMPCSNVEVTSFYESILTNADGLYYQR